MKELSPRARRALRARAHPLRPLVMIGAAGLTDTVLQEIDRALRNHELIKIRMLGEDRAGRDPAIGRICSALDAAPVQIIGRMLVVFRPKPEPEDGEPRGATAAPDSAQEARRGRPVRGGKRRSGPAR